MTLGLAIEQCTSTDSSDTWRQRFWGERQLRTGIRMRARMCCDESWESGGGSEQDDARERVTRETGVESVCARRRRRSGSTWTRLVSPQRDLGDFFTSRF